jgi:hypothetical protein
MTIPVSKGGTWATRTADGFMTDVGPNPMCVYHRSPVTSAETSHMPVPLTRAARTWRCWCFDVSSAWRFIMFWAGTGRTRARCPAIRAAAPANWVSWQMLMPYLGL